MTFLLFKLTIHKIEPKNFFLCKHKAIIDIFGVNISLFMCIVIYF